MARGQRALDLAIGKGSWEWVAVLVATVVAGMVDGAMVVVAEGGINSRDVLLGAE